MTSRQDSPLLTRLVSFAFAISIHAAVLFAGAATFTEPVGIGDGGSVNVELVPGPPGEEPPPPPPPPAEQESMPQPPEQEMEPETPPPDQMVMPDAEEKPEPPKKIVEQYHSPVYSTNEMSAEERERSIRFLKQMGRPGTGQVGSTPGAMGGGGGGGGGIGGLTCKKCPPPEYPEQARKMGQEGTVVLAVLIGADGKVETVVIKEGSGHFLLDQAALRAVRRWEVEPRKVAGIPVSTQAEKPIIFQLKK